MVEAPAQRIVPGAPPPIALTKSQLKKKRKTKKTDGAEESAVVIPDATAAALVEQAPAPADVESGAVAPELVVQEAPPPAPVSEAGDASLFPLSPVVDLISKRLKATNKKIVCSILRHVCNR